MTTTTPPIPEATPTEVAPEEEAAEFKSFILTVDHTSMRRDDGHTVQKIVAATQTVTETVIALLNYYEEQNLLAAASTIALFQQHAINPASAVVYRTKENIQIVVSSELFAEMVEQTEGNLLSTTSLLLDTAGHSMQEADKAAGGVVPLLLLEAAFS